MPNDAKLGLLVGVGMVVAVAALFFHKDPSGPGLPGDPSGSAVRAVTTGAQPPPRGSFQPVPAVAANRTVDDPADKRHTVKAGETLSDLAKKYYGDEDKFLVIYRANRGVLERPDIVPPGVVLVIPHMPN